MSLNGNAATDKLLKGKINGVDVIYIDAYKLAVMNGFDGTIEEWFASMKGEPASPVKIDTVTVLASAWQGENNLYSQVVTIDGITPYSKVDLLPSVEQLAIFHNKDVAFVTENEDGVVTVYAIGDKPTLDYTMQVQITEVQV